MRDVATADRAHLARRTGRGSRGPRSARWPMIVTFESRTRPSSEYIATLLPEPDSPTMPTTSLRPTRQRQPVDGAQRALRASRRRPSGLARSAAASLGVVSSGKADPRVEPGVEHVDDGVGQHDEERAVEDAAHDHRQVEVLERRCRSASRRRAGRTRPRSSSAAPPISAPKSRPKSETIEISEQRSAWRSEDPPFGEALGPRGAHVVLVQGVDQLGAQHARVDARVEGRQREPREEQVQRPLPRVLGRSTRSPTTAPTRRPTSGTCSG